jgi:hypothetical protein
MSLEGRELKVVGAKPTAAIAENVAVMLDSADTSDDIAVKQATAGADIYGINAYPITATDVTNDITATIVVAGEGKLVKLGATPGTISRGSYVKADADGEGVVTTTARELTMGMALAAGDTEGQEIPISVRPGTSVRAAS